MLYSPTLHFCNHECALSCVTFCILVHNQSFILIGLNEKGNTPNNDLSSFNPLSMKMDYERGSRIGLSLPLYNW